MVDKNLSRWFKENISGADDVSFSNGVYTFRQGYYYRSGGSSGSFAQRISDQLKSLGFKFELINHDDQWRPFKGGASLKAQSHFWAAFKIKDREKTMDEKEEAKKKAKAVKEAKEPDQEFDTHGPNPFNSSSIESGSQLEQLRQEFAYVCGQTHVTVNVAVTKIRKILSQYNIFIVGDLPRFAEDEGEYFFAIYKHDSDVRIWDFDKEGNFSVPPPVPAPHFNDEPATYLYVAFELSPTGFFHVDIQIITEEELDDLIGDDEVEEF